LNEEPQAGAERQVIANRLEQALGSMAHLARRLMTLGREGMGTDYEEVNLLSGVYRAVDFARTHKSIRSCNIQVSGDSSVTLRANPRLLGVMILNILLNAAEATNGKARIEIMVQRAPDGARIVIQDNGPGLPEKIREKLFTPFATTKANGTGLGLLSIRATAQQHRGDVQYETSPLGGACFKIALRSVPA
jgi:signal transduction histidine kinase